MILRLRVWSFLRIESQLRIGVTYEMQPQVDEMRDSLTIEYACELDGRGFT